MKVLLKAFAVLALAATAYAQNKPLVCEVTEPKPYVVWQVGEVVSTAWTCETPNNRPLKSLDNTFQYHIELGRGDNKHFEYEDTLDAAAKLRFTRFDWHLKDYPPGDNYVIRMFSKTKDFRFPKTQTESDKLDWHYIFPIAIVAKGDDKGLKRAEERFADQRGGKDDEDGGDKKDAKDKEAEESAGDDSAETDKNGAGKNGADESGAEGPGADGSSPGADGQGNSATSLLVGNSLLFAASAIAGALVL